MLPIIFKPKYEYNLIRLGKNNDGGYLVEKESIEISTENYRIIQIQKNLEEYPQPIN